MTAGELLTADEVAAVTKLSRSALYARRARRLPPESFKLGGRVVYEAAVVEAWIASQREQTSRGGTA